MFKLCYDPGFLRFSDLIAVATGVILAIVFLQSSLDKLFDYKGNLSWLKEHFGKTFLRATVGVMLPMLTLLELSGGLLCAAGALLTLFNAHQDATGPQLLLLGHSLVMLALMALMFGQRVVKDYAGAASLTGYILIALVGLYVMLHA